MSCAVIRCRIVWRGVYRFTVDRPIIRSYRDLIVWQKAMRLVASVYELTQRIPKGRDHGLGSQLRRAALSVASNIAEGHGRDHLRDYLRHLSIAKGSLSEVETQLLTARTVGAALSKEIEPLLALADEIGRMLTVLSRTLKAKLVRESPEVVPSLAPITRHPEPDP